MSYPAGNKDRRLSGDTSVQVTGWKLEPTCHRVSVNFAGRPSRRASVASSKLAVSILR